MKMLSRVCAEFRDKTGAVIYRIKPADRLCYIEDVPDAIREDPLFHMLKRDRSIEVVETPEQLKKLESDPTAGIAADGRRIVDASGVNSDDSEVTRNKRSISCAVREAEGPRCARDTNVRGTVAPIEGAEQREKPKAKAENKAEDKSAEAKPAGSEQKK